MIMGERVVFQVVTNWDDPPSIGVWTWSQGCLASKNARHARGRSRSVEYRLIFSTTEYRLREASQIDRQECKLVEWSQVRWR